MPFELQPQLDAVATQAVRTIVRRLEQAAEDCRKREVQRHIPPAAVAATPIGALAVIRRHPARLARQTTAAEVAVDRGIAILQPAERRHVGLIVPAVERVQRARWVCNACRPLPLGCSQHSFAVIPLCVQLNSSNPQWCAKCSGLLVNWTCRAASITQPVPPHGAGLSLQRRPQVALEAVVTSRSLCRQASPVHCCMPCTYAAWSGCLSSLRSRIHGLSTSRPATRCTRSSQSDCSAQSVAVRHRNAPPSWVCSNWRQPLLPTQRRLSSSSRCRPSVAPNTSSCPPSDV